MCYECDTYQESTVTYDGESFCSDGCMQAYRARQIQRKQRRVETIDKEIRRLREEKSSLLMSMGIDTKEYPWS